MGWLAAGLLALSLSLDAAEVSTAKVRHDGDIYRLHVVARINASPLVVWKLLTDYGHLERLHHSVQESTYLGETADGMHRVRIRLNPCIMFFCVEFTQVVEFRAVAERKLLGEFDQRDSRFQFGQLKWCLTGTSNADTHLVFDADLSPAFWIPPLLGPWILKRALRKTAMDIVMNLDRMGQAGSR